MISGYDGVLVAIVCIHGYYILLHSLTLSTSLGTIKCHSQSFSIKKIEKFLSLIMWDVVGDPKHMMKSHICSFSAAALASSFHVG